MFATSTAMSLPPCIQTPMNSILCSCKPLDNVLMVRTKDKSHVTIAMASFSVLHRLITTNNLPYYYYYLLIVHQLVAVLALVMGQASPRAVAPAVYQLEFTRTPSATSSQPATSLIPTLLALWDYGQDEISENVKSPAIQQSLWAIAKILHACSRASELRLMLGRVVVGLATRRISDRPSNFVRCKASSIHSHEAGLERHCVGDFGKDDMEGH
jgi:hypothetical protein